MIICIFKLYICTPIFSNVIDYLKKNMAIQQKTLGQDTSTANQHEEWFSSFINGINEQIKIDKNLLEQGDASKEKMELYRNLMSGDNIKLACYGRKASSSVLIKEIIIDYLELLSQNVIPLKKLAIDTSPNKVLIWAEINEDDEESEMGLISIESKLNARFGRDTDIHLDSTIVEDCDNLPIPSHYKLVNISVA